MWKMLRCVLLVAILAVAHGWDNIIELTEDNKQDCVEKHNELRASVGSSNMEYLMWDEDLAEGARILADTCIYEHDYLTWDGSPFEGDVGQNIFSSTGDFGPTWPLDFWWSENMYYDYNSGSCSWQCDHYTQMVWWNNLRVGCAKAHCAPLYTPGSGYQSNTYYFVCNYAPGGNIMNEAPYVTGEACTSCESRLNDCFNDLCLSQEVCSELRLEPCTCSTQCQNCGKLQEDSCSCDCPPGFFGMSCEEACRDILPQCDVEWGTEMCEDPDTKQQMYNNCPLFCGVCDAIDYDVYADYCATTLAPSTTEVTTTVGEPTTTTMYQQLCNLYGLFCELARSIEKDQRRARNQN